MKNRFWLLLIILMAFGVRIYQLGAQSLWYDEGVTWYLTRFSLPELVRWTAADIQPPLYYLLEWGAVRFFGQTEFALRYLSVVFGVLSVPLMWQMACALLPRRNSAWAAMGFIAIAPLMVYYSQEARMYALLVFQSLLGSWLLWRMAESTPSRHLWQFSLPKKEGVGKGAIYPLAYILVMASALYTHYFAVFLLLAHAGYWLLVMGVSSLDIRRSSFVIVFGGIALLFAPWMPVLLARLGDDPSYWRGALKLSEVVRDVALSFAVGGKREMIREVQGLPLAASFAVLLGISVFLWVKNSLLHQERKKRWQGRPLLFLLLWLVVPIAGVILLSYRTPKFNPRYTMLAWAPFMLILVSSFRLQASGFKVAFSSPPQPTPPESGGVAADDGRGAASPISPARRLTFALSAFAALFIIAASLFSLNNWFFVPQFSKDDFKHVAQFIRERYTPGDTILLSSGHFFPVWEYYFGAENWTPLPQMDTLDVNRVTDFSIIPTLKNAVRGHSGAWLVTWQNEVIDPNGVVPLLLDWTATRTEDDFHAGDFWGVGLHYWKIPKKPQFPADFPTTVRAKVNFGGLVSLRGLAQLPADDAAVTLLWQAQRPLTEDYLISLRAVDANGVPWSEPQVTRPAAYLFPTPRWQAGKVVPGRQPVRWLPGTPPGEYRLEVQWLNPDGSAVDVLDAADNPQGRTAVLSPVRVSAPIAAEWNAEPLARTPALDLLSATAVETAEAGSRVTVDALWRVNLRGAAAQFWGWRDSAGNIFPLPEPVAIPTNFGEGKIIRTRPQLFTPVKARPGAVTLLAQTTDNGGTAADIPVLVVTLIPTDRNFTPPESLAVAVNARFGEQVTLLGADGLEPVAAGDELAFTLFWRSDAPFETDYTVFIHLLGADGTPVVIADHLPPRSTSNWTAGEIIADAVTFTIPADLPPGEYPLEIGLYNAADPAFPRLPLDGSVDTAVVLTAVIGD